MAKKEFIRFFSKWFWISIILIFISLIINYSAIIHEKESRLLISILIELFKNIGLALFISNIFYFILDTDQFIEFIREKLIKIIISKEFISKLGVKEKEEMLKNILRPTKELSNIYSGIVDFFNHYIQESLTLFDYHYRSGLFINGFASIDQDTNKLKIEMEINYRIFKVSTEYQKFKFGFEDEFSYLKSLIIQAPDGKTHEYTQTELAMKKKSEITEPYLRNDKSIINGLYFSVPHDFINYAHLDIYSTIVEYGEDNWKLCTFRTSQPVDKVQICIICIKELIINKYTVFANNEKFNVEKTDNKIIVRCNDWLKPYFGVSILINKLT